MTGHPCTALVWRFPVVLRDKDGEALAYLCDELVALANTATDAGERRGCRMALAWATGFTGGLSAP